MTHAHPLSLYELNSLVRSALETTLPEACWIVAEVSEARVAAGGHCYVEFVEKDAGGNRLTAKARGCIWKNAYALLAPHFERATGQPLRPGMKVLVQVEVTFHELYGYALNVIDIDPSYTLGDLARRRQEILERLDADGVRELNKELPLPRLLSRIAVISSSSAAGYGDFCNQLEATPYCFTTHLFPATMQGERVEESIIAALDAIAAEAGSWDVAVIIRGGGAVSDLNGFDTYLLAASVAQFPLPVITGIGHERDDTVIDLVAHTRMKTPTAVADFIIARQRAEADRVDDLEQQLRANAEHLMETLRHRFEIAGHRLQQAAMQYAGHERARLERLAAPLFPLVLHRLQKENDSLSACRERVQAALGRRLEEERRKLDFCQRAIALAAPERILRLGFSITRRNGKAVRSAKELAPGDLITTCLAEGETESIVKKANNEKKRTHLRASL